MDATRQVLRTETNMHKYILLIFYNLRALFNTFPTGRLFLPRFTFTLAVRRSSLAVFTLFTSKKEK